MKGYNDVKRELKKMWDIPVKVIPVLAGALGTTPKKLKKRLSDIGIETRLVELQKSSSYILQESSDTPLRFKESCLLRNSRNLTTDRRSIQSATSK